MGYQRDLRGAGTRQNILMIASHIHPDACCAIDVGCNEGIVTGSLDALGLETLGVEAQATAAAAAQAFAAANHSGVRVLNRALSLDDLRQLPEVDVIVFLSVHHQLVSLHGEDYANQFLVELFRKARLQLFFQPCAIHLKYGREMPFVENDTDSITAYFDRVLGSAGVPFERRLLGFAENMLPVQEPFRPMILFQKQDPIALARGLSMDSGTDTLRGSLRKTLDIELRRAVSTRDMQSFDSQHGWHHFVSTGLELRQALKRKAPEITWERTSLARYYAAVTPAVFSDLWRMAGRDQDIGVLAKMPVGHYCSWLPWRAAEDGLEDMHAGSTRCKRIPEWDFHAHGPVSAAHGMKELTRMHDLLLQLEGNGYVPELHRDGHVRGYLLRRGGDTRFVVTAGQHRMAALAALGHSWIRAKFQHGWERVIDAAEVAQWPLVQAGVYTPAQALNVFNGLFEADGLAFAHAVLPEAVPA
jgi:hypothetical protein